MKHSDIRQDKIAYVTSNGDRIVLVRKNLDDKEAIYRVFFQDIEKRSPLEEILKSNDFEDIRKYWKPGYSI